MRYCLVVSVCAALVCCAHSIEAQWLLTLPSNGLSVNCFLKTDADLLAAVEGMGVIRSTDNGATWTSLNHIAGWPTSLAAVSDTETIDSRSLFCSEEGGPFVYRSTNNGISWRQANMGLLGENVQALLAVYDPGSVRSTALIAGTFGAGIFRSADNGDHWYRVGLPLAPLDPRHVFSLCSNGTHLLAGGIQGIYNSTDYGQTWTRVTEPFPTPYVRSLAVAPSSANSQNNVLFAGTFGYSGLYTSTNSGQNWFVANNGLTSNVVWTLVAYGSNVFAGTDRRVFLSTNSGQDWKPVSEGLLPVPVHALAVSFPYLLAGTATGIWRRPLSEMIPGADQVPSQFSLWQNYPNPFNSTTTLVFELPTRTDVSLIVFDALGQQITVLFSGELPPGQYRQLWNASEWASGVYYAQLYATNYRNTKRLLLLK